MCTNCGDNTYYYFNQNPCSSSNSAGCGCSSSDADNIVYTGPDLENLDVVSNDTLSEILDSINTTVGTITGIDWGSFDYACLDAETSIATAQEFVEAISAYVCALQSQVDGFIDDTYTPAIEAIQESLEDITQPGFTSCDEVGITDGDTQVQAITKLITAVCNLFTSVNPSGANWNTEFATDPLPETIEDAFNVIIAQIGNILNNPPESNLPTFNNENSCLSITGTTDSLYNTVVAIRDALCELPTFDINNLPWTSCIPNPNAGGGADIESALSTMLTKLSQAYSYRVLEFDTTFFTASLINGADPCSGYSVTLNDGIPDKFVALEEGDTPDYLLNKITAGTNIEFDTTTTPGTVIINSTAEDIKVKADPADAAGGYLTDKIVGGTSSDSALTVNIGYDSTNDRLNLQPQISYESMFDALMDMLEEDTERAERWCAFNCNCQPCVSTSRTIRAEIINNAPDDVDLGFIFRQSNPTVEFLNISEMTVAQTVTFSSGNYAVTTTDASITGNLELVNMGEVDDIFYSIYVLDGNGDPVSGASTQVGSLAAGATLALPTFTFGTATETVLVVEITGEGTTTTTTTTAAP